MLSVEILENKNKKQQELNRPNVFNSNIERKFPMERKDHSNHNNNNKNPNERTVFLLFCLGLN